MFPVSVLQSAGLEVLVVVPVTVVVVYWQVHVTLVLVAPLTVAASVRDWLTITVLLDGETLTETTLAPPPLPQPPSQKSPATARHKPR